MGAFFGKSRLVKVMHPQFIHVIRSWILNCRELWTRAMCSYYRSVLWGAKVHFAKVWFYLISFSVEEINNVVVQ